MSDKMRMIMDVGLGSDPMPDLIRVEKNGIRTTFVIEGKAESQLKEKDKEIDELKNELRDIALMIDPEAGSDGITVSLGGIEEYIDELKGENEMLIKSLDRCADDYGKAMAKYEALKAKTREV